MSPPDRWRTRLTFAAWSTLGALVLAEVGLRLAGTLFLARREVIDRAELRSGRQLRILCIGESTTAPTTKDAYPAQLQRILRELLRDRTVAVINKGVPGIWTRGIVAQLPRWLDQYRPDVVVAMMGANDHDDESPPCALGRVVDSLRVVRLLRLVVDLLAKAAPERNLRADDWLRLAVTKAPAQEARCRARIARNPRDPAPQKALGALFLTQGRVEEATAAYRTAIGFAPDDDGAAFGLAATALARRDQAEFLATLRRAMTRCRGCGGGVRLAFRRYAAGLRPSGGLSTLLLVMRPDDDGVDQMLEEAYLLAVDSLILRAAPVEAAALLEHTAALPRRWREADTYSKRAAIARMRNDPETAAVAAARATELRRREIPPFTIANYRRVRDLVQTHGAVLVAVQYPLRSDLLRDILENDPAVVFVGNDAPFRSALEAIPYDQLFVDAFGGDFGHATAQGNAIIAANVAAAIAPLLRAPLGGRAVGDRSRD